MSELKGSQEPTTQIKDTTSAETSGLRREVSGENPELDAIRARTNTSMADAVEAMYMLPGEPVTWTYSEAYGIRYTFNPDGTVLIEEDSSDISEKRTPESIASSGPDAVVLDAMKLTTELKTLLPQIPEGNLEGFGGRKAVIETLVLADKIRGYAKTNNE